jgi:hypothetical protein
MMPPCSSSLVHLQHAPPMVDRLVHYTEPNKHASVFFLRIFFSTRYEPFFGSSRFHQIILWKTAMAKILLLLLQGNLGNSAERNCVLSSRDNCHVTITLVFAVRERRR